MEERDYKEHIITSIVEGSIAEEMGIEVGDILQKINDQPIKDIFDFYFLVEDEYIEIQIYKTNEQEEWVLEIEKDINEDLGIRFQDDLMDHYRTCRNKCIFCFIDQMPEGMRKTLYFKDDDSRLSFLKGNYITLTNMKEEDIQRIIKYRMSPINVSVHTTNPELRVKMLKNKFAGDVLKYIRRLADEGIALNGQVVLCKGVNDGEELKRTIRDLYQFAPLMQSVSVVPVGLSKFRDKLYPLEPFTKEEAGQVIDLIEEFQKEFYAEKQINFIHASDEFYIKAERPFPEEERYDQYQQLENGVGMVTNFMKEFKEALAKVDEEFKPVHKTLATSLLPLPFIKECVDMVTDKFPMIDIACKGIVNKFFGEYITVSGLLTGQDIIEQLKGVELGDCLILPDNLLKADTTILLDDLTIKDIEEALDTKIILSGANGKDLLNSLLYNESSVQPTHNKYEPKNI